ncbi:nuclear transport factor 2 family protein [Fodinibius sp.]|uniref:nuclear transport factor 2 family protein n=1 Tax=Fodinibius sp. TaxID=1872440 RepID=UPI002ACDA435|nr:nuclear transport factor 2 family protein [Fodinibius sp.]MDZ7660536.1 nuclear transport factor 2 family protein [Fodinibius sp.]
MKNVYTTLFVVLITFGVAHGQQTEKESVLETLDNFKQAIVDNDSDKARQLLSDSVRILEGGNIETKEEYLSHHFHSDGKFLSSMKRDIESQNVSIEGTVAWVSTRTHVRGTYNERELNLSSLELAVLERKNGSWKITALHWSSAGLN